MHLGLPDHPFNFFDTTHFELPKSELKRSEDNLVCFFRNNLHKRLLFCIYLGKIFSYAGEEPNVVEKRVDCKC